jgi:hypothetical protein
MKGYCTELPKQQLSNELIIGRYHQLWHIDQLFRLRKFDLQTQPISSKAISKIKAHVLIYFVALMTEK